MQYRQPAMPELLACGLIFSVIACEKATTQLVVVVNSNLEVPAELAEIQVHVSNDQGLDLQQTFPLNRKRWPLSFGIALPKSGPDGVLYIDITAYAKAGVSSSLLLSRSISTGFVSGKIKRLPVFLAAHCVALQDSCKEGQTCTETGCRSPDQGAEFLDDVVPGQEFHHDALPRPQLVLTPSQPLSGQALSVSISNKTAYLEESAITYLYRWAGDDQAPDLYGPEIGGAQIKKGQSWQVRVHATDGLRLSPVATTSASVGDSLPSVLSAMITPTAPFSDQDLVVQYSTDDADGEAVDVTFKWYLVDDERAGSGRQINGVSGDTLLSSNTSPGQKLRAELSPSSRSENQIDGPVFLTEIITVLNRKPVVSKLSLSPQDASMDSAAIIATAEIEAEPDGQDIHLNWTWKIDGQTVTSTQSQASGQQATLRYNGMTMRDKTLRIEVTPNDGFEDGDTQAATVTMGNSRPVVSGVSLSSDTTIALALSTLRCGASISSDVDEDPVNLSYRWYLNQLLISNEGSAVLGFGNYHRGDSVVCGVVPDDGLVDGLEVFSSPILIGNTPPEVSSAELVFGPYREGAVVTVNILALDIDLALPRFRLKTFKNSATSTAPILLNDIQVDYASSGPPYYYTSFNDAVGVNVGFQKGDQVWVEVTPIDAFDGSYGGTATAVATEVISNSPPSVLALPLLPNTPTTNISISIDENTLSLTDPDHSDLAELDLASNREYRWLVNSTTVTGANTNQLDANNFQRDDRVQAGMRVSDGADWSAWFYSEVQIANSPPSAPTLQIVPAIAYQNSAIDCRISTPSVDADNDPVSYRFEWSHPALPSPSPHNEQMLFPGASTATASWTCTVTPSDGYVPEGDAAIANRSLVPTPPRYCDFLRLEQNFILDRYGYIDIPTTTTSFTPQTAHSMDALINWHLSNNAEYGTLYQNECSRVHIAKTANNISVVFSVTPDCSRNGIVHSFIQDITNGALYFDQWMHFAVEFFDDAGQWKAELFLDGDRQGIQSARSSQSLGNIREISPTIGIKKETNFSDTNCPIDGDYWCYSNAAALDLESFRLSSARRYAADFTPPTRLNYDASTVLLYRIHETAMRALKDDSGLAAGQIRVHNSNGSYSWEDNCPWNAPSLEWISDRRSPTSLDFLGTEVTVSQFNECVTAGPCNTSNFDGFDSLSRPLCNNNAGRSNHPMNCVNWYGAIEYCSWIGARLPFATEWQIEASNGQSTVYPWGDDSPSCDHANYSGCTSDGTRPVCAPNLGRNQNDLCDLAGNVSEWTLNGPQIDPAIAVGGGFDSSTQALAANSPLSEFYPKVFKYSYVGFRCVR